MPGMGHSSAWWHMYEGLRASGHSKSSSAAITNAHFSAGTKHAVRKKLGMK